MRWREDATRCVVCGATPVVAEAVTANLTLGYCAAHDPRPKQIGRELAREWIARQLD